MIKKLLMSFLVFFICSCSNIELVLKEDTLINPLKNKTLLVNTDGEERILQQLYFFLGKPEKDDFILEVSFNETKKNVIVKKNQVAEKIDYELTFFYKLYFKTKKCNVFNKKVITSFSFVPKSSGYNFGTDRSFEKLYNSSIKKNIRRFIDLTPNNLSVCIE